MDAHAAVDHAIDMLHECYDRFNEEEEEKLYSSLNDVPEVSRRLIRGSKPISSPLDSLIRPQTQLQEGQASR